MQLTEYELDKLPRSQREKIKEWLAKGFRFDEKLNSGAIDVVSGFRYIRIEPSGRYYDV